MRHQPLALVIATTWLGSCGSMPAVTVSYYFPKAETQLQLAQTIACNDDGSGLFSATAVTPTTQYVADRRVDRATISFKRLSGSFSNADVTVKLTDDGRLQGVNAVSEGDGGAIVKSVLSLTSVFAVKSIRIPDSQVDVKGACAVVKKYGADKPVTISYEASISYDDPDRANDNRVNQRIDLRPVPGSRTLAFARLVRRSIPACSR